MSGTEQAGRLPELPARSYVVRVGEREFLVEIADGSNGQPMLRVDGQSLPFELLPTAAPLIVAKVDGSRLFAAGLARPGEVELAIRGELLRPVVEDRRAQLLRRVGGNGRQAVHEQSVKAPMPGLVVGVPVAPGDTLTKGTCVVVLQAMKMENELRVAVDGEVAEVRVSVGQTVDQGQILVVLK